MRTYTQEELKEILELHQKWLNDKGGIRANLSNDDLYGANLRNANLCSSDLSNANLYGANLSNANLSNANLYGANSYGANLNGANLRNANLCSSDLRNANLSNANLSNANLSSANLYGANLSNANLYGANLRNANLRNANLCSSDLRNANLYGANLKGANLKGANLLRTIGDMQFVKSFQFEKYMITYTDTILNIGCKSYTINEWGNFTNKEISVMDNGAVEWWTKWKPIIMQIIKMSPAESTYYGDPWSVGLGTTTIITGTPQCHLNDS